MADIEAGDIVRVTAKLDMSTDDIINVYHLKHAGSGDVTQAAFLAVVDNWLDTAYGIFDQYLSNAVDFVSIDCFNVTQDEPIGSVSWPTMTSGGDSTADAYAKQVAPLVRFPTATARSQGRKFLGGFTEAQIGGGGTLSATLQSALASFGAQILAGFTASGEDFIPGNWNQVLGRFAPWLSAVVNIVAATQRRRRIGVGS